MLTDLSGKVAVVTGGAAGMGRGIAERMLAAGMNVMIADIEQGALDRTTHELGIPGVRTDVGSFESVAALAEAAVERFGTVHVVCNNAGVGSVGPIAGLSIEDWRWVIDVNLYGVIHGVHAFLPILAGNPDGGHIVNTSSVSGLFTGPTTGPYSVTKFGVVALTEVLAQELEQEGSKVGASVLIPGPTRTAIATSQRNRQRDRTGSGLVDIDLEEAALFEGGIPWKTPGQVGDIVIDGIMRGDLYIYTHPELIHFAEPRHRGIEQAAADALARASAREGAA